MLKLPIPLLIAGFCQILSATELRVDSQLPQVLSDLNRLSAVKLSSSSTFHKQFFGPSLSGSAYIEWLDSRVRKIELDPQLSECGSVLALACIADDQKSFPGLIFVWNQEFDIAQTMGGYLPETDDSNAKKPSEWIRRMAILVHESRHLPSIIGLGKFPFGIGHIECPQFSELKLCDNIISGAYGFEAVFLLNISKYCAEGCSAKDKQIAHDFAISILNEKVDPQSRKAILEDINSK